MARPIIALVTDFGLRDHYVGSMKGAILGICPEAAVVDITHELPAHDVHAGASALAAAFGDFPPGTVFVAVVDPGVGSARRGIAADGRRLSFCRPRQRHPVGRARSPAPARLIVELTSAEYARAEISRTFEGRDRFAPAAAWLATGVRSKNSARPSSSRDLVRLETPAPTTSASEIGGEVVRVDRFGNLITNVDRRVFDALSGARRMAVRIGEQTIPRGNDLRRRASRQAVQRVWQHQPSRDRREPRQRGIPARAWRRGPRGNISRP